MHHCDRFAGVAYPDIQLFCATMYVNTLAFKPLYNYLKQHDMEHIGDKVLQSAGVAAGQLGSHMEHCQKDNFYQAYQLAMELTGDDLLGLHIGEWLHPSNMGLLGYAMCNCATIKDALYLVLSSNSHGYGNDSVHFSLSFIDGLIKMTLDCKDDIQQIRPWIEFTTAGWKSHYHHLTNLNFRDQPLFSEVSFPFSAHGKEAEYQRVLGCPVRFNQKETYITGSPAIFAQEIYTADSNSLALFMEQLGIKRDKSQLEDDIQTLIKKTLPQTLTLEQAAKTFNFSASTLKRRLSDSGTSFNKLSLELKTEMAKQMLRNKTLSINEISYYLGYGKPSAFFRAFKNTSGMTPAQFRNK